MQMMGDKAQPVHSLIRRYCLDRAVVTGARPLPKQKQGTCLRLGRGNRLLHKAGNAGTHDSVQTRVCNNPEGKEVNLEGGTV